MILDIEAYWHLPPDSLFVSALGDGSYEAIKALEMRGLLISDFFDQLDHSDACSIAERVRDFHALETLGCLDVLDECMDYYYHNDTLKLDKALQGHDRMAIKCVSNQISQAGYAAIFSHEKSPYMQILYAIGAGDTGAIEYLRQIFTSREIIESERGREPLLSYAYRQQNLESASSLAAIHDDQGASLAFNYRFFIQSLSLHPIQSYLMHAQNRDVFHNEDPSVTTSIIKTVYGHGSKQPLSPGLYSICEAFASFMDSDEQAVIEKEKTRCDLYVQNPTVRLTIKTIASYQIASGGFLKIHITSKDAKDSLYNSPKSNYPFLFHHIFVSTKEDFISAKLLHEAGHFIDTKVNANKGMPYNSPFQKAKFLKAASTFLDNVGHYLLNTNEVSSISDLNQKAAAIRDDGLTVACEAKFQFHHGNREVFARMNRMLIRDRGRDAQSYIDSSGFSSITVFVMHRIYEWAGRREHHKQEELLNRLAEILTQLQLTEAANGAERLRIIKVLEPLQRFWDQEYKPVLEMISNTTQCAKSIFFSPDLERYCNVVKNQAQERSAKPAGAGYSIWHIGSAVTIGLVAGLVLPVAYQCLKRSVHANGKRPHLQ